MQKMNKLKNKKKKNSKNSKKRKSNKKNKLPTKEFPQNSKVIWKIKNFSPSITKRLLKKLDTWMLMMKYKKLK